MQSLNNRRFLRYAEYGFLALFIGILVLFFLNRVRSVHKNAERMAVMGEVNALRGGAVAMLDPPEGTPEEGVSGMNPVRLLQAPPKNYLGEIEDPESEDIPAASWYFHPDKHVLIYRARFAHEFPFTRETTKRLRLRLRPPEKAQSLPRSSVLACGPYICLTSSQAER